MVYHVIVSFARDRHYRYAFSASELADGSPEEARRWFDKEYADLQCEPTSRMGKVLIIDKILGIARRGGEQRFIDGKAWARQFARYTVLVLGRDTITIDLEASRVSY
jgi:hypothetical protein